MGGDLEKIQLLGKFFIETWKASGMKMERVKFLWASEEILKYPAEYFDLILKISTRFSLNRIRKCCTIMGRKESEKLQASQILYPILQAADIHFINVDCCQLGLDQRKVNVLSQEFADNKTYRKPIICSHQMLPGLAKGQEKMSKSLSNTALFMEDSEEEIAEKIKKAYCEEKDVEKNPCISYFEWIVFPLMIEKEDVVVGNKKYNSILQFKEDYKNGEITPQQLKQYLITSINLLLTPVREHFKKDEKAAALYQEVQKLINTK